MRGQPGFFDIDDRLKRLSDLLEAFRSAVDFELRSATRTGSKAGGHPSTRC